MMTYTQSEITRYMKIQDDMNGFQVKQQATETDPQGLKIKVLSDTELKKNLCLICSRVKD